jgi:Flp pilus assembly pilin Flp
MKMYAAERGQGLVEYALIFALVVLVILVIFVIFGPSVGHMYSNVVSNI